jgi:hypothetical protein
MKPSKFLFIALWIPFMTGLVGYAQEAEVPEVAPEITPEVVVEENPVLEEPPFREEPLSEPTPPPPEMEPFPYNKMEVFLGTYVLDRLEIGAHMLMSRSFDSTSQGDDTRTFSDNFFGSIDRFDPDTGSSLAIYVQYALCDYFGVGFTFDDFSAKTRDAPYGPLNSDGDVNVDSTLLYTFFRYPNEYNVIPYLELGYGSHDIGFSPESSWAARGNSVAMESDSGVYYALGIEYAFSERFCADVFWRTMSITGKGEYRNRDGRDPIPFEMNFDHTAWGLGVKYIF